MVMIMVMIMMGVIVVMTMDTWMWPQSILPYGANPHRQLHIAILLCIPPKVIFPLHSPHFHSFSIVFVSCVLYLLIASFHCVCCLFLFVSWLIGWLLGWFCCLVDWLVWKGRFSISTLNLEKQRIASGAGGLPSKMIPKPLTLLSCWTLLKIQYLLCHLYTSTH